MEITLRAARVNKNLTQEEAANALGVSKQTIGNWEKGRSFPAVRKINMIEKLYGIKYNEIIFLPKSYT